MQQRGNDLCLNDLMFRLQTIITEKNPFALAFKNMAEVEEIRRTALEGRSVSVVKMSLFEGQDRRRYNLPSHNEVPVVFVGEDGAPPASREVVIYPRGHPLKTASSMSANLDPMFYPLFFLRGDAGWHNWFTTLNVLHWLEIMLYYLSIAIINFQLDIFFLHSFMGKICFSNMLLMRMLKLKASTLL